MRTPTGFKCEYSDYEGFDDCKKPSVTTVVSNLPACSIPHVTQAQHPAIGLTGRFKAILTWLKGIVNVKY